MRPQPIPTWLEDAAEAVGQRLRTDGEIVQTTDIVEQTGLPAHRVSSALKLLVDLGVVERRGQREHTHPRHVAVAFPGGRVSPGGHWTTQFYYQWVGERSAAAEVPDGRSGLVICSGDTPAAAPPATEIRRFRGDRWNRVHGSPIPVGEQVRVLRFFPRRRVLVSYGGQPVLTMLWCLEKIT